MHSLLGLYNFSSNAEAVTGKFFCEKDVLKNLSKIIEQNLC